jgi:hypothetical protein
MDVAALKSGFIPPIPKANGFRCEIKFFTNNKLNKLGSIFPALTNFMVNQPLVKGMGVASKESAFIGSKTFRKWKLTNQKQELLHL